MLTHTLRQPLWLVGSYGNHMDRVMELQECHAGATYEKQSLTHWFGAEKCSNVISSNQGTRSDLVSMAGAFIPTVEFLGHRYPSDDPTSAGG